jgi:hypothetical protein
MCKETAVRPFRVVWKVLRNTTKFVKVTAHRVKEERDKCNKKE